MAEVQEFQALVRAEQERTAVARERLALVQSERLSRTRDEEAALEVVIREIAYLWVHQYILQSKESLACRQSSSPRNSQLLLQRDQLLNSSNQLNIWQHLSFLARMTADTKQDDMSEKPRIWNLFFLMSLVR